MGFWCMHMDHMVQAIGESKPRRRWVKLVVLMGVLGGLGGWMDGPLAIDVTRAAQLRAKGYAVITRTIPEEITPKNRLLMAHP